MTFVITPIITGVIDIMVIKIGIIGTNAKNAVEPNIPPVICYILLIVPYNL